MSRLSCAILLMSVCLRLPAYATPAEDRKSDPPTNKTSIYALGDAAVRNLYDAGREFGKKICSQKNISTKEDIKSKAWANIKLSCNDFTFGLREKYSDDPREIFTLCIGGALAACQEKVGVETPCHDLRSCQALLGIPD